MDNLKFFNNEKGTTRNKEQRQEQLIKLMEYLHGNGLELDKESMLTYSQQGRGANLKNIEWANKLPLHFLCNLKIEDNNSVAWLQFLIDIGLDCNQKDKNGQTPLMLACAANHCQLILQLLSAGADPNFTDEFGQTALVQFVGGTRFLGDEQLDIFEAFRDKGAKFNSIDDQKWELNLLFLVYSQRCQNIEKIAHFFLVNGVTPNIIGLNNSTLKYAWKNRHYQVVWFLLHTGANFNNAIDFSQQTPQDQNEKDWCVLFKKISDDKTVADRSVLCHYFSIALSQTTTASDISIVEYFKQIKLPQISPENLLILLMALKRFCQQHAMVAPKIIIFEILKFLDVTPNLILFQAGNKKLWQSEALLEKESPSNISDNKIQPS